MVPSSFRVVCAALALVGVSAASPAARRQDPLPVAEVLQHAANYLAKYEEAFSSIVSQERYRQTVTLSRRIIAFRELKSDLLVLNLGGGNWAAFRDVYEVDGKPVRDHQDRILELFTHPKPDILDQAKRIVEEGARFNLGSIVRTLNTPTVALAFLRRENQDRSTFTIDSVKTMDGTRVVVLRYTEHAQPRMIISRDNAAATGRIWVEQESGRVRQTELLFHSAGAHARVTVAYAPRPKLELWVPVSMDEEYTRDSEPAGRVSVDAFAPHEIIEGHATYAGFVAAKVDVSVIIKLP